MQIIITGSGTSFGMPVIGCHCSACTSENPRDKRYRASAYITDTDENGYTTHIVIDVGPEYRLQALDHHIDVLDAVLLTHSHADHVHGLDDLRAYSHTTPDNISSDTIIRDSFSHVDDDGLKIYSNRKTIEDLKERFSYIFHETQKGGGKPKLNLIDNTVYTEKNPLILGRLNIIPIPMLHGKLETSGYLISVKDNNEEVSSIAYLTDCSYISEKSLTIIKNNCGKLKEVVIDGLRPKEHSTHCSFRQAMSYAEILQAEHTWITHICHDMKHTEIQEYINEQLEDFPELEKIVRNGGSVAPAYDGLVLNIN
ncbi:MAG: MBL fold metallo-hydrolase [Treponema sp.]|nr:MBL fold metallo-hydrolase [Treponema sp.]